MTEPNQRRLIVAYRGNFSRPFCTEVHVAASLEALGHQVIRLQENQVTWAQCVEAAKQAHLFLWQKTWIIDPEGGHAALEEMKAAGIPTASFHLDRYIGLDREAQIADGDPFWRTQFVFTADGGNDEKFAEYGVNHFWMPPGMYDDEAKIGRANPRLYPERVIFVGSYPYPHAEWREYRSELITRVEQHFGKRFAVWPKNNRPIRNRELSDLYASCAVVIGDSCLSGGATHYWSDRVPETLGRGALLIHPYVEGLDEWYTSAQIGSPFVAGDLMTYELGDFDEVIESVEWALANPEQAKQIATHGQATVLARDTYKHRLAEVLRIIGDHVPWPEPKVPNEQVRVNRAGIRATRRDRDNRPASMVFNVRAGHPTDREVISEVWGADQYRVKREHVAGGVVIDIGANIGAFSALVAGYGAAEVHAFEPEPSNAEMLRLNVAEFENVTVHQQAVGDADGVLWLSPGPDGVHGGGTHGEDVAAPEEGGISVEKIGIETFLARWPEVALVKIDCEGGEYEIINGLWSIPVIKRIVMEFHGPGMPHLSRALGGSLDAHLQRFGWMVAKLAQYGYVEIHGRPEMGGLLFWQRY